MPKKIVITYSVMETERKVAEIMVATDTYVNRSIIYDLIDSLESGSSLPPDFELEEVDCTSTDYDIDFDYEVLESDETTVNLPPPVFVET